MITSCRGLLLLLLALLSFVCFGQEPRSSAADSTLQKEKQPVKTTALKVESVTDISFPLNPFIVAPVVCGEEGTILVRTTASGGVGDLTAISKDGKWVKSFDLTKMTDIVRPSARAFFVRDSDVYMLVHGSSLESEVRTVRRPDGSTEKQVVPDRTLYFVAHFKQDGSYRGAVSLDIPILALQIGVFPTGDFLIAGTTKDMQETRIALVNANGQFNRYVELKDDIRLQRDTNTTGTDPSSLPNRGKRFGEGFNEAAQISSIVADGRSLLLVRKGQQIPVFSISAGGEVENIRLDVPEGYQLWDIRPTPNFWVALFVHRISDTAGVEFVSMAMQPNTGKVLQSYSYERFPGFGLACTDGTEFSFLIRDDNQLKILKLISSGR